MHYINSGFVKSEERPFILLQLSFFRSHNGSYSDVSNCAPAEVKGRLYLWNACYHSVQNLLSSFFQSKTMCIYRPVVLPVILCVCESSYVTLGEEHRLKVVLLFHRAF